MFKNSSLGHFWSKLCLTVRNQYNASICFVLESWEQSSIDQMTKNRPIDKLIVDFRRENCFQVGIVRRFWQICQTTDDSSISDQNLAEILIRSQSTFATFYDVVCAADRKLGGTAMRETANRARYHASLNSHMFTDCDHLLSGTIIFPWVLHKLIPWTQ